MKKLILTAALLFSTAAANAQLIEGTYFSSKGKYTVITNVCDAGYTICNFEILKGDSILVSGSGEWFQVNLNGVGDEYNGPGGWYTVKLDTMNLEIDITGDNEMHFYNPYAETKERVTLKIQ